ncbi:hypothetical protein [Actinoplanes couchii]|uniref:hypothetical protein n=1 Tax=Actinoplanes couchii TaxID=403638 RepID=UPI0019453534|nr:hypothetical protein [Actinoplanes couchii]MDR6323087.1 hypothetical protein [Actinoplanes couchii]
MPPPLDGDTPSPSASQSWRPSHGAGSTRPSSSSSRSPASERVVGCGGGGGSSPRRLAGASFQLTRTRRVSSTSTVIGTVVPGSGHFSTGTRDSRTIVSKAPSPGATTTSSMVARP